MTTWASGYVADLPYVPNFFRELSPAFLHFAAVAGAGVTAPDPERRIVYCELGCGQGFNANVIAAANPHIEVHAMDFNPSHIAGAKALAAAGGLSNVHFYEDSFADFLLRPDLPAFDTVVLHGVFSWVSPARRAEIVALIQGKLTAGGLVYVSYNAQPGTGALIPLRRLMYEHAESGSGTRVARIEKALEFAEAVRQLGARDFAANPALGRRLDRIKSLNRAYLAHEYFNRDWNPLHHKDVVDELAEAKVTYVGSALLAERLDGLKLSPEQRAFLASITNPGLRETARDSILNTDFRQDLFMRGVGPLPGDKQIEIWLDTRFALAAPRDKVRETVNTTLGEVTLDQRLYSPVADALAEGPCTLRELFGRAQVRHLEAGDIREAAYILLAFGHVEPCLKAAGDKQRAASTRAFNAAVMERARHSYDQHLTGLASPVTGGGINLDRFSQLLLSAKLRKESDIPAAIWAILKPQGGNPSKDGRRLETDEEILAELADQVAEFELKSIPVLKQLGIA